MKPGVHMVKDDTKKLLRQIAELPSRDVLVGIPGDRITRVGAYNDSSSASSEEMTNADLGYIHENGAPEANIPARPWLVPGIRGQRGQITNLLKTSVLHQTRGETEAATRALHAAGVVGMIAAQRKITTGPFAPLAASTIRARRKRGRTGTRPLIDTGQLRRAITYVIRERKSG